MEYKDIQELPKNISKIFQAKANNEKDKETVQPTVINDTMILRYAVQYNKENNIFLINKDGKEDKPIIWDLEHLQLSYKNIWIIDNLKGMEKLQKLQLDNNIIQKIQNMDHLVNLTWLDLSFNQIEEISGLETLTKLTDLSLYDNCIKKIEGLETLTQLKVLSFGRNRVKDLETTIQYLKDLKNEVEVLNMQDNPYALTGSQSEQGYKYQAVFRLKNLKYIDYVLIDESLRQEAEDACKDQYQESDQQGAKKDDDDKTADPILVEAHIDCTDRMLDKILAADADGQKLKKLGQFDQHWQNFEAEVSEKCDNYQKDMKNIHKVKKNAIVYCMKELRGEELKSEKKSIKQIQEFESYRKHKMLELNEYDSKAEYLDDYLADLMEKVSKLEDDCMTFEMSLQEALLIAVEKFKEKVLVSIGEQKQKTINFIKFATEQAQLFDEAFREYALDEQQKFEAKVEAMDQDGGAGGGTEQEEFDDEMLEYMLDKEVMVQHLDTSKEFIEGKIQGMETSIMKAIQTEWRERETKMTLDMHKRNRAIVKEIIDTVKMFKEEISKEFTEMKAEEDD